MEALIRNVTGQVRKLALVIGFGLAPVASHAQNWQFEISPYLFAAGLDGKTGVNYVTANVDADFDDILENLDSAFMGMVRASSGGPWSLMGTWFTPILKIRRPAVGKDQAGLVR